MKTNRFTITELLVVIAIIAILAGMLLPALDMARWKARHKNWQTQTGRSCDINDFRKAFVGYNSEKIVLINENLLPSDPIPEPLNTKILYDKWENLTGNPKGL